jgi:hypothetical protein
VSPAIPNSAPHLSGAQWQHVAELGEQSANAIQHGGSLFNKSLSNSMKCQIRLLLDRLDGNETHIRSGYRLTDRLGIIAVVLPALAIRSHKFRCHQFHAVTKGGESPRPLVSSRTRFHANQAGRQLCNQLRKLRPRHRPTDQDHSARIDAMH